jgi:Preprotein translocase SecG subunit.
MSAFGVVLTVIITISALFMIFTVLMQSSNVKGLGAIAGTFDSYFDKHKAKSAEAKLALGHQDCCGDFRGLLPADAAGQVISGFA